MQIFLLTGYWTILSLLAIYVLHRLLLTLLYVRIRSNSDEEEIPKKTQDLPRVTIQLPIFNERFVVNRLLDAVAKIEYPKHLLDVQVLDDSTDATKDISRKRVDELQREGLDILHLHRIDRRGFKAGALDEGLKKAKGEFIAIFDADFLPPPEFLRDMLPHFADPKVGMVQARWGHLNERGSLLTRVQAIMLDAHFFIEHKVRKAKKLFMNFNGTAGIWRREAIEDAGGWKFDTLTEDLDLSYRAQMRGWKFVYLHDHVVPAELPADLSAFRTQQYRWAKGAAQTMRKLLVPIFRSSLPLRVKVEAFFHLSNHWAYTLLIGLVLFTPLVVLTRKEPHSFLRFDTLVMALSAFCILAFFVIPQLRRGDSIWKSISMVPVLVALGAGFSVNNARAILSGVRGKKSPFIRTPKYGARSSSNAWRAFYGISSDGFLALLLEISLAVYLFLSLYFLILNGSWMSVPMISLFGMGFGYVALLSLVENGLRRSLTPE